MSDITIKILGVCGAGKTTISQLITNAILDAAPNNVTINFNNHDNISNDRLDNLIKNVDKILANKTINIEEIQINRNGVN